MKSSDVSTQPRVTAETREIKRDHCLRGRGQEATERGISGYKQIQRINGGI